MRTIEATITSQGQVTIPAVVQRKLGLNKREKVTFVISDNHVELVPSRFSLEDIFDSVEPLREQSDDLDLEIEEALEDHADEVMRGLESA